MSQRPKMSWRRQITRAIEDDLRFMNSSKFSPPSKLTLTTGASGTLFEFGGQDDVHGIATIIAAPGGQPSHTRVLNYPEPCGLHSAVTVWPGCVVLIAGHRLGSIRSALYRVDNVIVADGRDQFGKAELTLLGSIENLTRREDVTWISEWAAEIPLIVHAYRALMDKLFTFKCTKPMYLEWFRELKSDEYRGISKKMLEFVQKDQEGGNYVGLDGRSVDTENIVNTYDTLIREMTAYADEIHKKTNHFVWCTLAYLQLEPGEFVVHGRIVHSKYGFRDTEIHVGDRLYIFNVDCDEKVETIDDFFHRHLEEYRRALLGRYRVAKHLFAHIHRNDVINGLGSTVSAQICRYAQCCHRQLSSQEIATIRAAEEKDDVSVKIEIPKVELPVKQQEETPVEVPTETAVESEVQPVEEYTLEQTVEVSAAQPAEELMTEDEEPTQAPLESVLPLPLQKRLSLTEDVSDVEQEAVTGVSEDRPKLTPIRLPVDASLLSKEQLAILTDYFGFDPTNEEAFATSAKMRASLHDAGWKDIVNDLAKLGFDTDFLAWDWFEDGMEEIPDNAELTGLDEEVHAEPEMEQEPSAPYPVDTAEQSVTGDQEEAEETEPVLLQEVENVTIHMGLPETFDVINPQEETITVDVTEENPKAEPAFDIENGVDLSVSNEEKKSTWFDTSIRQLAEGVHIQSITVKEVVVMDRASETRIGSDHPDYSAVTFEVNDTFTVVANAPGHLYVGKAIVTIIGSQK